MVAKDIVRWRKLFPYILLLKPSLITIAIVVVVVKGMKSMGQLAIMGYTLNSFLTILYFSCLIQWQHQNPAPSERYKVKHRLEIFVEFFVR